MKKFKINSQSGSVFTVLLAGVAMAGALSIVVYQIMSGPMASMVRVGNKTMAKTQLHSVSNIMIMDALNQAASGDCDSDGSVEPREWRATTGDKPGNGGLIPNNVGAPLNDPWNTEYGYCVWDTGPFSDPAVDNGCGASANRLKGSPDTTTGDADTQYVVAIVSAGPNRQFETACNPYVDLTTGLLTETGDDVITKFTYAEASSATTSIWKLKVGAPDIAQIEKDLEIGTGVDTVQITTTGADSGLIRATAITTLGLIDVGGAIRLATEVDVTSCVAGNEGDIRYNTVTKKIESCDGLGVWSAGGNSDVSAIDDLSDAKTNATSVFLGNNSGAVSTGSNTTAVGVDALVVNTTASNNTAIGRSTLKTNTLGEDNTAVATSALYENTTGGRNTALGGASLYYNKVKSESTAIGYSSMAYADPAGAADGSTITYNTAVGAYSLRGSGTSADNIGTSNTALGHSALYSNTSGYSNVASGWNAMNRNTEGSRNVAIGAQSLFTNTIGIYNNALGWQSMYYNTTGNSNVAIGIQALHWNDTGNSNTAIGTVALVANILGSNNTALGYGTLDLNTEGNNNLALGYQAGDNITTGSNNIMIGASIDAPVATASNQLNIGNAITGDVSTGAVAITGNFRLAMVAGAGAPLNSASSCLITSTGGTKVIAGDYNIHVFIAGGTFTVPAGCDNKSITYMVVAGGGAGGLGSGPPVGYRGGGGGAGGYRTGTLSVSAGAYPIVVGSGGAANSANGNDSSFSTITSAGGGGGGNATGNATGSAGKAGGSGGGASGGHTGGGTGNSPATVPAQGSNGASGNDVGWASGAGGGLAATISISGVSTTYATGGPGGCGSIGCYTHANDNTGNGGGGGTAESGWHGGSGIVVIRYLNKD